MEILFNRINSKFIKNDDEKKILKAQCNLAFDGIRHTYDNYSSYMFRKNILPKKKPIHIGSALLDLSKFLVYET